MWKLLCFFLWGMLLWGCEYTGYEDLSCSTSTECPMGSVCRSGFCAFDGEPQLDMAPDEGEDTVVALVTVATNATINLGETAEMTATARNSSGEILEGVSFIWSSEDPEIATVRNGIVSTVGPGTTTISALAQGATGNATVTVLNPPASVEILPATRVMGVNTVAMFNATVRDANGEELVHPVQWESSDTSVLTVSQEGIATGVGEGQATIRAEANDQVFGQAEVDVQVFEANVLELSPASLRLPQGATEPIVAHTYFRNNELDFEIFDEPVQFDLSSSAVGSISNQEDQGRKVAIFAANEDSAGDVVLTARLRTLEVTAEINVYEPMVSQVSVTPQDPSIRIGDEQVFIASVLDQFGEVMVFPVEWSVVDEAIAGIDQDTGVAQGLMPGDTSVTAVADGISASSQLFVSGFGASQVSAGREHSCAISLAGFGYCWGEGARGRLGYGSAIDRSLPVRVRGNLIFSQIVAADEHSCGISQGFAYCWGRGHEGRLGTGSTSNENEPVAVAGEHEFTQISGLNDHTCGVTTDETIYCWGRGEHGRLGNGETTHKESPVLVSNQTDNVVIEWVMVSAGGEHSCALSKNNEVFCWGLNANGQLGDGTTDDRWTPTPVDLNGLGLTFDWVGAGHGFSCAKTQMGALYCWGSNVNGRLGIDSAVDTNSTSPELVRGGHTFLRVALGRQHACATTATNTYCWGEHTRIVGVGMDQRAPFPILNASSYTHLDAGGAHTCGVRIDNLVECFGQNNVGQMGVGNTDSQPAPEVVWP